MRDPRPMTVSAYFHIKRHNLMPKNKIVDKYFRHKLDIMCQWVSLRYFFFKHVLADQSELFWYGDHQVDPLDWHGRFLGLIGLNLPLDETIAMTRTASEGNVSSVLAYNVKGIDEHPDGRVDPSVSTFEDELGEESLQMMDEVLRRWLPPVVLSRLGVLLP